VAGEKKGTENRNSHRIKIEINFADYFQNNLKSPKCIAE
jgi:hypothetical protein